MLLRQLLCHTASFVECFFHGGVYGSAGVEGVYEAIEEAWGEVTGEILSGELGGELGSERLGGLAGGQETS